MSVPICRCFASLPDLKIVYCPLHVQAAEFFEIIEGLISGREQVLHHQKCHCVECRMIKAVFRARGLAVPERTDEAEVQRRGPRIVGGS